MAGLRTAPVPRLAALLLVALAGCDLFTAEDPAWTQAGAVARFDYEAGPDSLSVFVGDGAGGGEHRSAASRAGALEMLVVDSPRWRRTDRYVSWRAVPPPGAAFATFEAEAYLPLDDEDIAVVQDGVAVVVAVDCYGGGWFGGGSRGTLTFVRAPNRPGTVGEYGDCTRSLDATAFTYPATGPETVTVPAGTFSTIRVERPGYRGGVTVELWSWEAGLVRLDVLNEEGVLRGRFVRSAGG